MAETFRAQLKGEAGVTKLVVIKKVLPTFSQDQEFVAAFINEARLSATLSHGNIAQVFDFGRVDGDYFIAMELVDGRSLHQMLNRAAAKGFEKLPVSIACFLAIEVLKGLQYAHTRVGEDGTPLNLVHRDVSPENVLISFEGQTKVVDFGVAKAAMRGRAETEPGLVKGKFQFFSPEQAVADPLDGRSDVFAVGILLYRMLCGVLPFEGQMHNVMRAIVAGTYRPPLVVNPHLPQPLATVLAKAMAIDRTQRYATALEMQEALAAFLYGQEPTFSSETVKEWMTWLFAPELEAERRSLSLSSRFRNQLEQWKPETKAEPAAAAEAITGDAPRAFATPMHVMTPAAMVPVPPPVPETLTRPGTSSKGVVPWIAGGALLLAIGLGINEYQGAEPAQRVVTDEEARQTVERATAPVEVPHAPVEPINPQTVAGHLSNEAISSAGHEAIELNAEAAAAEDAANAKKHGKEWVIATKKINRAKMAMANHNYQLAQELLSNCEIAGKPCPEAANLLLEMNLE